MKVQTKTCIKEKIKEKLKVTRKIRTKEKLRVTRKIRIKEELKVTRKILTKEKIKVPVKAPVQVSESSRSTIRVLCETPRRMGENAKKQLFRWIFIQFLS